MTDLGLSGSRKENVWKTKKINDMKKFIFIASFLMAGICGLMAQEQNTGPQEKAPKTKNFRYQGSVDFGFSYGMESESAIVHLDIVNGVRFSRYLYAGVGGGAFTDFVDEAIYIPLYFNVKGYVPVGKKVDLMAGVDLGTCLDYNYGTSGGLLLRPEFGISTQFTEKFGMTFAVKYDFYSFKMPLTSYEYRVKTNQIGLKIDFNF